MDESTNATFKSVFIFDFKSVLQTLLKTFFLAGSLQYVAWFLLIFLKCCII